MNETSSKGCKTRTAGVVKEHSTLLSVLQGKVEEEEKTLSYKRER